MVAFVDCLLDGTTHPLYITSLTNERTLGREKHVSTRDKKRIGEFVKKYDVSGRAVYYCVSTIPAKARRNKENAAECKIIFVDIDYKDILAPDDALTIVKKLPVPPNRIHLTGHGLHALWFLKTPVVVSPVATITPILRKLCRVLGGDPHVCHVAALLRWPGSHNSKDPKDVKTVKSLTVAKGAYELETIEKWLTGQDVIIHRKDRATNPYQEFIDQMASGTPIDVDTRLKEMEFQGSGSKAIHTTQVACSASLLSRGEDPEEVIETILEATETAAGAGIASSWNWDVERLKIEKMVASWEDKHKDEILEARAARANGSSKDNVVKFPGSLAFAQEPKKTKKTEKNFWVTIADAFLQVTLKDRGEQIMYAGIDKQLHRYRGGVWQTLNSDQARKWLEQDLGATAAKLTKSAVPARTINEAIKFIERNPDLFIESVDWDSHGKIPTLSGLVDPDTLEARDLEPEDFATYCIQCNYDPKARCVWWERMLKDCLGDIGSIDVLQEWMGAALIENKPKELMKAYVPVGPSNSGKSNLMNALTMFLCDDPITVSLDTLENAHGLMPFLKHRPWRLDEAFDEGKWHFSAIAKALMSGDPVSINVKNGPMETHRYRSPILWGANTRPQFKEASKAMRNRMIIQPCSNVFDEEKLTGAALEARNKGFSGPSDMVLATERSAMLNWALEGWRRLKKRGHFSLTEQQKEELHEMEREANYVTGCFEDCIEYDVNSRLRNEHFYRLHSQWWTQHRGEANMPSNAVVGKAIKNLGDPRVTQKQVNGRRYIYGVKANDYGKQLWALAGKFPSKHANSKLADTDDESDSDMINEHATPAGFKTSTSTSTSTSPGTADTAGTANSTRRTRPVPGKK